MKNTRKQKRLLIFSVSFNCLLFFLFTAHGQPHLTAPLMKHYSIVQRAYPNDSTIFCTHSMDLLLFNDKEKSGHWINQSIRHWSNLDTSLSLDSAVHKSQKQYINEYLAFAEEAKTDSSTHNLQYAFSLQIKMLYLRNDYLILSQEISDYGGGPHGNYSKLFQCYDIRNRRIMALSDIVNMDSSERESLLHQIYSKKYDDPELTSLDGNSLLEKGNFYFDGNGLHFFYNAGGIGAYVDGTKELTIPYQKIWSHLRPTFKKRMHK